MTREEAIETIRRCCPKVGDSQCDFESAMRELIPELAESENERIRKMLLELAKNCGELNFTEVSREATIAYLERQKEQKPVKGDLPVWRKWKSGGCGSGDGTPIAIVRSGHKYILTSCLAIEGEEYIMLSDLEKLPKEDSK